MFALVPRVRRTWEALGAADVPFSLDDQSGGWLALADPDQLDQVLWAILDNAVGYGGRFAAIPRSGPGEGRCTDFRPAGHTRPLDHFVSQLTVESLFE